MTDRLQDRNLFERQEGVTAPSLMGWDKLGARVLGAAFVATTLHLARTAGGRPDGGAAVETPRIVSGG